MSHNTMLDLSRWQWGLTAAMHITFPAVTVGTSVLLVVCYAMYMRTDDLVWLQMFRFWRRSFGIGFALGVVSGIVLTFEFGLNWARFGRDVGPIFGNCAAQPTAESNSRSSMSPMSKRCVYGPRPLPPSYVTSSK